MNYQKLTGSLNPFLVVFKYTNIVILSSYKAFEMKKIVQLINIFLMQLKVELLMNSRIRLLDNGINTDLFYLFYFL